MDRALCCRKLSELLLHLAFFFASLSFSFLSRLDRPKFFQSSRSIKPLENDVSASIVTSTVKLTYSYDSRGTPCSELGTDLTCSSFPEGIAYIASSVLCIRLRCRLTILGDTWTHDGNETHHNDQEERSPGLVALKKSQY